MRPHEFEANAVAQSLKKSNIARAKYTKTLASEIVCE
jgi:hypothetical protein